jgi:hypothetical protein
MSKQQQPLFQDCVNYGFIIPLNLRVELLYYRVATEKRKIRIDPIYSNSERLHIVYVTDRTQLHPFTLQSKYQGDYYGNTHKAL